MEVKRLRTPKLILIVFIYFVVTSAASLLLGLLQPALGIPDEVIEVTQFGPTLGVLAILLFFRHEHGIRVSIGLDFQMFVLRRILYVVVLVIAVFALAVLYYRMNGINIDFTSPAGLSHSFWLIVVFQFIGAAGEEFGWRCFLQPTLQGKIGVLPASILVGVLWGVWHVGVFAEGWAYALLFILSAVSISVILGQLLKQARKNNLVIATVFHALTNLGLLLFFDEENGDIVAMGTIAWVFFIVAVVVVIIQSLWNASQKTSHLKLPGDKNL